MIRSLREVFLTYFRNSEEETEEDDGSQFTPSPLDLSVRIGYGGRDDEVVRELSKIDERAREIDENRRDR